MGPGSKHQFVHKKRVETIEYSQCDGKIKRTQRLLLNMITIFSLEHILSNAVDHAFCLEWLSQ